MVKIIFKTKINKNNFCVRTNLEKILEKTMENEEKIFIIRKK
jgi:hypothetical protein